MMWNTVEMRSLEEPERLKTDRKLLKPQVERRRRERMNRSLENLRTLLLQGPEAASQRRVEKAEILEHTVLFLQTSMAQTKTKNQASEEASEGKQFLDGFSACLHEAARFLQTEGESRGLQGSLSTSLYQRLSHPHVPAAGAAPSWVRISPRTSVPEKESQRPTACTQGLESARRSTHPYSVPARHTQSAHLAHHHRSAHTASRAAQAEGQQCVWRPWP